MEGQVRPGPQGIPYHQAVLPAPAYHQDQKHRANSNKNTHIDSDRLFIT